MARIIKFGDFNTIIYICIEWCANYVCLQILRQDFQRIVHAKQWLLFSETEQERWEEDSLQDKWNEKRVLSASDEA